ncbi:claudin-23-like [Brachyhypopomus gauderio]|uniref:claudin-23-like n=1 Tax=Brachyhypopomus gauderio TaxID=698409 RepID=UPI004042B7F6
MVKLSTGECRCVVLPCMVVTGFVLVACGWLLSLTSTVAPNWRSMHNVSGEAPEVVLYQGIWHMCKYSPDSRDVICNHMVEGFFEDEIIETAQRMMAASLLMTMVGLTVATFGVRCWSRRPSWTGVCLGGFVVVCSGLLTVIPVAWYAHLLTDLRSPPATVRVGYCITLGYAGGIMEILGGFVMFMSAWRYGGKDPAEVSPPQTQAPLSFWKITA